MPLFQTLYSASQSLSLYLHRKFFKNLRRRGKFNGKPFFIPRSFSKRNISKSSSFSTFSPSITLIFERKSCTRDFLLIFLRRETVSVEDLLGILQKVSSIHFVTQFFILINNLKLYGDMYAKYSLPYIRIVAKLYVQIMVETWCLLQTFITTTLHLCTNILAIADLHKFRFKYAKESS